MLQRARWVLFSSIGGPAAILAKRYKKVELVEYEGWEWRPFGKSMWSISRPSSLWTTKAMIFPDDSKTQFGVLDEDSIPGKLNLGQHAGCLIFSIIHYHSPLINVL